MKIWQKRLLKALITLLGLVGLHLILRDFGYARIRDDIASLGFYFIPVATCFLLPFTLQALAWRVLMAGSRTASSFYLFLVTLVTNAWNNIGPVSKSLGEPTRVILLADRIPVRRALRSMMLINLAQAMGTIFCFSLGALVSPLFFTIKDSVFWAVIPAAIAALSVNGIVLFWISRPGAHGPTRGRSLRALLHWFRWVMHQLRKYTRTHPGRYAAAVALCAASRLSEGVIFYVIFAALGSPLTMLESVAVDVGRGIADNIFFFVPYQLGTREYSLVFVTEEILKRGQDSAVAASLVFRLGEITWIVLGFFVGVVMMRRRANR